MFKKRKGNQGKGQPPATSKKGGIKTQHRQTSKQAKKKGRKRDLSKHSPEHDPLQNPSSTRKKPPTEEVDAIYEEHSQVYDSFHKGVGSIA